MISLRKRFECQQLPGMLLESDSRGFAFKIYKRNRGIPTCIFSIMVIHATFFWLLCLGRKIFFTLTIVVESLLVFMPFGTCSRPMKGTAFEERLFNIHACNCIHVYLEGE